MNPAMGEGPLDPWADLGSRSKSRAISDFTSMERASPPARSYCPFTAPVRASTAIRFRQEKAPVLDGLVGPDSGENPGDEKGVLVEEGHFGLAELDPDVSRSEMWVDG